MKSWFHEVYPVGYNLLCNVDDGKEAKLKRKADALKVVDNIITERNADAKEDVA